MRLHERSLCYENKGGKKVDPSTTALVVFVPCGTMHIFFPGPI